MLQIPLGIGRCFLFGLCVCIWIECSVTPLWQMFNNLEGNFKQEMSVSTAACHSYIALGCKKLKTWWTWLLLQCHLYIFSFKFYPSLRNQYICLVVLQPPWILAIQAWDKNFNLMLESKVRFLGEIMLGVFFWFRWEWGTCVWWTNFI